VSRGAKSRMRRTETPEPIWIQFCMVVDIHDVVTYTNFGDHRLRGFWVAGGQISPLSHRLSSSPLQHSFTTWKTLHNSQPLYLSELISHYLPSRSLRSSSTNLLTRPPGDPVLLATFPHGPFLCLHLLLGTL